MHRSTGPNLISSHSPKGARRFFEQIAALYVSPFSCLPFMEFWKHVPRVGGDDDYCVPNVEGHSRFLFSALTILFASWLASRHFVPTRNIKLCQGKTTVSRECFQHLFPSPLLFSLSLHLLSFVFLHPLLLPLFRFFLAREHDFLLSPVGEPRLCKTREAWKNWTWRA